MIRLLLTFCFCVWMGSASALGTIFEDRCQSLEPWTFIDYTGNLQTEIVEDLSCPPGYGPKVMQIHGDVAMGLASAPPLQEGTFVALYKEETPAVNDAYATASLWYGRSTAGIRPSNTTPK